MYNKFHISLDLWILIIYILGITNGGYENSINDNHTIMNKSATTTSPHRPTPRIMTVTSKSTTTTTTNYENFVDESNGLTQATIITEPYFDSQTPRNVTGLVGKSAYLSCRVRNIGNKSVSWIRHRDIHILTVGSYTYTSDQRFQATHHKETDDWTLQIKWAQKRDGGVYECQISTQPVKSYFVNLNVVVPTASILGGPDLHFDKGSTINLTCTIKYSPEPPAYIFWYHHDEVISYDSQRGGVSVITEKGDITTSYLLIQNADLADSGRYSCSPSNADVASVRVHVLNENQPEAMQTGSCGKSQSYYVVISLIILIAACNFIREEIHLSSTRQWPSKAVATANNNKEEERKNKRSKKKASTKLSQTSNNIKQQNNNTKKNILSFLINHKLHDEKKQSPQQHQVKGVFIATTAMSQETSFIRNVVVVKS